jgi:hypothetical protein
MEVFLFTGFSLANGQLNSLLGDGENNFQRVILPSQ